MLDMRFAGLPRFVVAFWPAVLPDNFDGTSLTEAMAGGRFPSFPASGINWTRHIRPSPPSRPTPSHPHLTIIK